MKNISKKITTTIYWLLLLFVILIAIVPTLSGLNIPLPFKLFAVQTGSMEPAIKVGDLIFVKEENDYKVNDVITYNSGFGESKTIITHRIVGINEDNTFKTKGDFNTAADVDSVNKENIIGKYIFGIPFLGYPINFVRTPLGFLILIVIPAVIISYEEIKKIKYEISSRKIKTENI